MPKEAKKLLEISIPQKFDKGEYIFYENQTGKDMYIVLSGRVGIYIDSLVGDPILVDQVKAGGFFGEMAVFDEGKRSASAAAMEETICTSINSKNLNVLIENCPHITQKILSSLSERIRSLNNQLYHFSQKEHTYKLTEFQIPNENKTYNCREEKSSNNYLEQVAVTCPVCKSRILIPFIKYAGLELAKTDPDFRTHYKDFDQLWHAVYSCPECGYANLGSEFQKELKAPQKIIMQVVKAQEFYVNARYRERTRFDAVICNYYKALHFNSCFHPENLLIQARLWMSMYWLYQEAADEQMEAYARRKAIACYKATYEKKDELLHTSGNRQKCAAIIGELCFQENDVSNARFYLNEVLAYPGETLKADVFDRIQELRADK